MNTNNPPLVSVLIPAYNHEKYVQETIKSFVDQTYQNIELIIIDDGSKDGTWGKINELKDVCEKCFSKIIFETQENQGVCITLNKLLSLANGEYICIVASDDVAKETLLEKEVNFLTNNPDYALVVGDNEFIDTDSEKCFWDKDNNNIYDELKAINKTFGEYLEKDKCFKFNSNKFGTYQTLYMSNYIPNGYMIRNTIFEKIPRYTLEAPLDDWFLMLQISKYAKMKYLNEVLLSYRRHDYNTIKQTEKMDLYTQKTKEYEEKLLKNIDKKEVLPNVIDVIKNGVLYKKEGIKFIFELLTYRKNGKKDKIIKIFGMKVFSFNKK